MSQFTVNLEISILSLFLLKAFKCLQRLKFSTKYLHQRTHHKFLLYLIKYSEIYLLENRTKWLKDSKLWNYSIHCFRISVWFLVILELKHSNITLSICFFVLFCLVSFSKLISFLVGKSTLLQMSFKNPE